MVSKEIGPASWSWQPINPDIAVITIQTYRGPVQIINVYNLSVVKVPQTKNIVFIISLLKTKNIKSILLKDINLHHLWWGGIYITPDY